MTAEEFGIFLHKQRTKKGITQEQLGALLSVSDKAVSKWERGECFPEVTQFPEIARIFGLTVDELFSCREKPESEFKRRLKMCTNCNNKKCKDNGYFNIPNCEKSFHWVIYGISVVVLLFACVLLYLITRIIDGNWGDFKYPLIIGIVYIFSAIISAMMLSLKDIKGEYQKNGSDSESEPDKT